MKAMPYPVRLPKHLHAGATGYVLELLRKGRISLSKAAELLNCSTLAILEKSRKRGVVFGATQVHYEKAKGRTRSRR